MLKIFLLSFMLLSNAAIGQTEGSILINERKKEIEDSLTAVIKSMVDSTGNSSENFNSNINSENSNPGLDYFEEWEAKKKAEEKKVAPLKIIVGVLLLGFFSIALTVKVKKKESRI